MKKLASCIDYTKVAAAVAVAVVVVATALVATA